MKKIALVFCHAIALVFGQGTEERSSISIDKHASTRQLKQHDIRLRGRIFRESENQQDRTLVRVSMKYDRLLYLIGIYITEITSSTHFITVVW